MSSPSKRTRPAVGSIRRSSSRPVVDLPQPDSPTRPSVSPAPIAKIDAVDGAHAPRPLPERSRRGRRRPWSGPALRRGVDGMAFMSRPPARLAKAERLEAGRAMVVARPSAAAARSRRRRRDASGQRGAKRQPARHRADARAPRLRSTRAARAVRWIFGIEAAARGYRDAAGASKIFRTGAISATRPA